MGYNDDFHARAISQCLLVSDGTLGKGWVEGVVVTFPDGDILTVEASAWAPTTEVVDPTVVIPDADDSGGTGTGTGT